MSDKTPHVKWWTTSDRETHGELHLDDTDAELFYPEPPYYPDRGVLYLCGYVKLRAAGSEDPNVPRCPACIARLSWAKQEGDRLVAEYHQRQETIEQTQNALTDPGVTLEDLERAQLARLLAKYPAKPETEGT